MNGNGSSENGDEPVDDVIESIQKNLNKCSEVCLKCPDKRTLNTDKKQDDNIIESNFNNSCCEIVISDENVPNIDLLEPFNDKQSNLRLKDVNKEDKTSEKSSCSSVETGNNDASRSSLEWINDKACKDPKWDVDGRWSSEEVDKVINRTHVVQRRQSAPLPRTSHSSHDTDSDGISATTKVNPPLPPNFLN